MDSKKPRPVGDLVELLHAKISEGKLSDIVFLALAIGCFIVGVALLVAGFLLGDWRLLAPAAIVNGLIVWPIKVVVKSRNAAKLFDLLPGLLANVSKERAGDIIDKLVDKLL